MRMLTKTLAILALSVTPALAIAPASAETAAPVQFSHDGETYVYTKSVKGERTIIRGKRLSDNGRFSLVLQNGRVRGTSNGSPVSFKLSEAKGLFAAETSSEIALAAD